MNQSKTSNGAAGRYVLRHILRSPGKSLLCLLLAIVFMLGLMLIRVSTVRSENQLEELYLTTTVTVEIIKATSGQASTGGNTVSSGFIYPSTVSKLSDTGFIGHRYVTAIIEHAELTRVDGAGKAVRGSRMDGITLHGVEYPQEFLTEQNVEGEITYFNG